MGGGINIGLTRADWGLLTGGIFINGVFIVTGD